MIGSKTKELNGVMVPGYFFWASRCNLCSTQAMPLQRLGPNCGQALGQEALACTWRWRKGLRQPKYGMRCRPG